MAVWPSRRTTVQTVRWSPWSVVKTVPGSVSSATGAGNWGSQPSAHARSPVGVKRWNARSGGRPTSMVPVRRTCLRGITLFLLVRLPLRSRAAPAGGDHRPPRAESHDHHTLPRWAMIRPMSSSLAPPDHPSHHSGPGYASAPPPPELAFDDGLSERFVDWLNYVPEAHRNVDAAADERAEAVLSRHVASCRRHPFEALFVAHRHLGDASPEVQLQALLLASEALWWLHHYADAP